MSRSDQYTDIIDIAEDVCANAATPEQLAQLQSLLRGNPEAQEFYYDYLSMHMRLSSPADRNMEYVYRRMTMAEEFVIRPKDSAPFVIESPQTIEQAPTGGNNRRIKYLSFIIVVLLIGLIAMGVLLKRNVAPIVAELINGDLVIEGLQGEINGNKVFAGLYSTENKASIKLRQGDTIHLGENSLIKIYNNREVKIKKGWFLFESSDNQSTLIHYMRFLMHTKGSNAEIDLRHKFPKITSGVATVLNPARWRPVHYWNFEGATDRIIDSAGKAYGMPATGVSRVNGMVGNGISFSKAQATVIEVGSGGGTVANTGTFAVNDGVSIEVLISPHYDEGSHKGYQSDIFRQDYADDGARISLSISSRKLESVHQLTLHFGLYILGQGYQELTLPLEAKDERPLHVAATYNVKTGAKSIYLDGKQRASMFYPPGSQVISGGSGAATIGNAPAKEMQNSRSFNGVIDEVAFYDFALPPYTVQMHHNNIQQGNNYYGLAVSPADLPRRIKFELPPNTTVVLDDITGLPQKLINESPVN